MANTFNCPQCGAQNTYTGDGKTVRCAFCGSSVLVPEQMVIEAATQRFTSQAKIWIILFVVVVFVLPTCLGFGGVLLGILGTIFSMLAGFIATLIGLFLGK